MQKILPPAPATPWNNDDQRWNLSLCNQPVRRAFDPAEPGPCRLVTAGAVQQIE